MRSALQPGDVPDFISYTVAAAIAGVSTTTLPRYEQVYKFPQAKFIGGKRCYDRLKVLEWLNSPDRHTRTPMVTGEDHHKSYPKEFVAEAIRLNTIGVSLQQIALRLGVSKTAVAKWCSGAMRGQHPADVVAKKKAKTSALALTPAGAKRVRAKATK